MVRRKRISRTVDDLLRDCRIRKPPVDPLQIAKFLGLDVVYEHGDDELSGFLFRDQQTKRPLIGINKSHPATRQKFTLAHECGHFLLHGYQDLHVDKQLVKLRDGSSSLGVDVEEKEANLFAAELLMPEKFLRADIQKLSSKCIFRETEIAQLAEDYGVSPLAMTYRLTYLGYLVM